MATVSEIKKILSGLTTEAELSPFDGDSRQGVQAALKIRRRQLQAHAAEEARLDSLLLYERGLYAKGIQLIAGIDEVGRGPLAGPVVAAAVILPENCKIPQLNDSKQIPKSHHSALAEQIRERALAIGIGIIDNQVIDKVNIYEATKLAMMDAVFSLSLEPGHLLIDAMRLAIEIPQTSLVHGDARSASIAAASLVAKVTRDQLMLDYAALYPQYGFEHNAGYGTPSHLEALRAYGPCPIHRYSFEPVKTVAKY